MEQPRQLRVLRVIGIGAGLLLGVIGVRFLLVPEDAQRTFGLGMGEAGAALHTAIGARDLWLAALVLAFVLLKNWQALLAWFAFGAMVCFSDAALVASHGARWPYVAFHVGSGIVCIAVAGFVWRRGRASAVAGTGAGPD